MNFNEWILMAVVVPILAAFFKNEIVTFFTDWSVYRNRAFNVGDRVELFNPNVGGWTTVEILDYDFDFSPIERVVVILHPGGQIERVPFISWSLMRKSPVKPKPKI